MQWFKGTVLVTNIWGARLHIWVYKSYISHYQTLGCLKILNNVITSRKLPLQLTANNVLQNFFYAKKGMTGRNLPVFNVELLLVVRCKKDIVINDH